MEATIEAHGLHFRPMIDREAIDVAVRRLGADIARAYAGSKPLFVCVLNGAFIFAADLLRACPIDCEVAFVRLSSYQGAASSGKVTTIFGLDVPIEDRHVIVVEDIVDTGLTLHHFMRELRQHKPASLRLAVLLLKPDALQVDIRPDYLGFEIPNRFVVGYGLDYDGLCRNLPDIYVLAE